MLKWKTTLAAFILLVLVGSAGGQLLAAPPPQENQYLVSSPTEGAVVSGVIEIIGTVTHPSFHSYAVFYAPGPVETGASVWEPIALDVQEPVANGVLAVWDTAALGEDGQPVVPNGVYHLTLVRWREGATTPDQVFVRNITVNNVEVTPTPGEPTETPPLPTVSGATPTPVPVEHPPTATPRASPTPESGEAPAAGSDEGDEGEDEGAGLSINADQLRGAFLDGAKITLLLFGLWGVYVFAKAVVRYFLRTRGFDLDLSLPWRKE